MVGQYVKKNKTGNEVWNFQPIGNCQFGYVRPKGNKINLKRLGAHPTADYVDDVTVVFVATRPEGKSVVVGWYDNARVWRKLQKHRKREYFARAKTDNCRLLEVDKRVLEVPRAARRDVTWGMGQSNVRYVDEQDETEEFIQLLRRYLDDPFGLELRRRQGRASRQPDQDRRKQVEKAAIKHVKEYYDGYDCESVEREYKGWDLEFTRGAVHLRVEVKGCSGHVANVELTPNEYKAMNSQDHQYRLAIVTNALDQPRLSIVSFNGSDNTWRDQHHRKYHVEKLESARITCK